MRLSLRAFYVSASQIEGPTAPPHIIIYRINVTNNQYNTTNYATTHQHHYGQHLRPARYGEGRQVSRRNGSAIEINALSAHRTPSEVEAFAQGAAARGLKVIIAGAGMAAALPGVIAASTTLPVIGVPIKGMLDGLDALLSIVQMPPGIPVATVGVNGAQNAAILALEMLALSDADLAERLRRHKSGLKNKIVKANEALAAEQYKYKTN